MRIPAGTLIEYREASGDGVALVIREGRVIWSRGRTVLVERLVDGWRCRVDREAVIEVRC